MVTFGGKKPWGFHPGCQVGGKGKGHNHCGNPTRRFILYFTRGNSMVLLFLFFFPQVYEVLKLLNELLPTSAGDQDDPQLSDKESFLVNQPDLLQKFGMDILPFLIQVLFLLLALLLHTIPIVL